MREGLSDVLCFLEANEKHAAIDEVIASCGIFSRLQDREAFAEAVHIRERQQSTGIGHGVAIAHGKIPGIDRTAIALGFSRRGIPFEDGYPDPVRLVFVIASPSGDDADYLHAVSSILTWVHDAPFRELLLAQKWDDERVEMFLSMLESQEFRPQP